MSALLYHGSPIGGLDVLLPELSEHGTPLVYFATDPIVALLYAVKPVPKPFSYYPYGFDDKGRVVYSEYFQDAFRILYQGQQGCLYECEETADITQPTHIACIYASSHPVNVRRVTVIPDLYEYYMQQSDNGMFSIRRFEDVPSTTYAHILKSLWNEIEPYDLQDHSEMKEFLQRYFPSVYGKSVFL